MVYKRVRDWTSGWSPSYKTLLSAPPHPPPASSYCMLLTLNGVLNRWGGGAVGERYTPCQTSTQNINPFQTKTILFSLNSKGLINMDCISTYVMRRSVLCGSFLFFSLKLPPFSWDALYLAQLFPPLLLRNHILLAFDQNPSQLQV